MKNRKIQLQLQILCFFPNFSRKVYQIIYNVGNNIPVYTF